MLYVYNFFIYKIAEKFSINPNELEPNKPKVNFNGRKFLHPSFTKIFALKNNTSG